MKIHKKNKNFIIFLCVILLIWFAIDQLLKRSEGNKALITVLNPDKIVDAPKFNLPDIEGRKRSLDDFQGSYILLNFWATW